jgi:hypothetical protein
VDEDEDNEDDEDKGSDGDNDNDDDDSEMNLVEDPNNLPSAPCERTLELCIRVLI